MILLFLCFVPSYLLSFLRVLRGELLNKTGPVHFRTGPKIISPTARGQALSTAYCTSTTEFSSPKGLASTRSLNGSRCQRLSTTSRYL